MKDTTKPNIKNKSGDKPDDPRELGVEEEEARFTIPLGEATAEW